MGNFLPEREEEGANAVCDWRDTPAPVIVCNFPMELTPGSPVAHTTHNGATRQIPGTQKSREPIPLLQEDLEAGNPDDPAPAKGGGQEPRWMKLSTTAPAPAGCAMIRDLRAW